MTTPRASLLGFLIALLFVSPRVSTAGDIEALLKRGTLTVVGDGGVRLYVDQAELPTGSFRITPEDGTTVNGAPDATVFSGVSNGLDFDLGDGNDQLTLGRLTVPQSVRVAAGDGDNSIALNGAATPPSAATSRSTPAPATTRSTLWE